MLKPLRPLAVLLLAAAVSCAPKPPAPESHGLDLAGMDTTVSPGDDSDGPDPDTEIDGTDEAVRGVETTSLTCRCAP